MFDDQDRIIDTSPKSPAWANDRGNLTIPYFRGELDTIRHTEHPTFHAKIALQLWRIESTW